MELIINSYVMGKGGKRLGILILSNTKYKFNVYYIQGWVQRWEFSATWISHFCTPFSNVSAHQPHTYSGDYIGVNTSNMSGMFIVLQPITGKIFTPQKPQATNGFRSVMEQIIFVLFKDTNCLNRNLKHRCSPRSVPRTASSTSFDFRKKRSEKSQKPTRRDGDQLSM